MKIFIDGGRRPAIRRLCDIWAKEHSVVNDPKGADVQLSMIRIRRRTGLPVLLRLDGVYYDKAENYNARNSAISRAHSTVDAVVYQSLLSRKMCEKYLTKRKTKLYDIIYNGIADLTWNMTVEHKNINVAACSRWRRVKRLPETVEIFNEFLNYCPTAKLHIIGKMAKGASEIPHPNIIYYGQVDHSKMKKVYSVCDMFIHLCKKDSCPSTVIEAIAAGMPVITTNACGGATEMCKLTEGCVIVPGEVESLEPDYIYKDKYNKMPQEVSKNTVNEMIKITEDRRRVVLPLGLTIENVASKYINIMRKII